MYLHVLHQFIYGICKNVCIILVLGCVLEKYDRKRSMLRSCLSTKGRVGSSRLSKRDMLEGYDCVQVICLCMCIHISISIHACAYMCMAT